MALPITTTQMDPFRALASLMEPQGKRGMAFSIPQRDHFVKAPAQSMAPAHPLRTQSDHDFMGVLRKLLKHPGDMVTFLRLSEEHIGVFFGRVHEANEKLYDVYTEYVAAISDPKEFALAWRDFTSLMLSTARTIQAALTLILARREDASPKALLTRAADFSLLHALIPYITSLKALFDITKGFYANPFLQESWAFSLMRGQKHHMANIFMELLQISYYLERREVFYDVIERAVESAEKAFHPIAHLTHSLDKRIVGSWLTTNLHPSTKNTRIPSVSSAFRRAVDEIISSAGEASEQKPQRLHISWNARKQALLFRSSTGAFAAYAPGTEKRSTLCRLVGEQQVTLRNVGGHDLTDRIQLAVAPHDVSGALAFTPRMTPTPHAFTQQHSAEIYVRGIWASHLTATGILTMQPLAFLR